MITTKFHNQLIEIRPVMQGDLEATLHVYRHCEDFLALGPIAMASMEMVLKDLEVSKEEGGIFCGIYTEEGKMIGLVDYVPSNFDGNSHAAFLSLIMIDPSFRGRGVGKAIVEAVENEIRKDKSVTVILSAVQVNNPKAIKFWQRNGYCIISEPKLMPDQTTVYDLRKELK